MEKTISHSTHHFEPQYKRCGVIRRLDGGCSSWRPERAREKSDDYYGMQLAS